jgi:EAL domain-containing protein (putative c-di-GMP-specific phosphodiesterase class I)/GGDEF domain-containing protein
MDGQGVGGDRLDPGVRAEIAAQLLGFAEQTTDFVGVTDPWGRILYLNPAARKRLGVADEATDLTTADVFPVEAFTLYYDVIRPQLLRTGAWRGEIPVKVAGGSAVPMYVSTSARLGPGGEINESVMLGREMSRAEPIALEDRSDVDEITGLLRRSAFHERVRLALEAASREGESCALVLVTVVDSADALEFDTLTAATVIRALAGRMKRLARSIDVVGRVGEVQLGLLLRGVRTHNETLRVARTVCEALVDAPVTTPGEEIAPSIACGVGFARPGADLVEVIEEASAIRWREPAPREAVAEAARASANRSDVSATMDEFRVGMSHGDVRPYAQPVVDLGSGLVVGYQGLARWHHRRLGTLEAAAFVDMIAESALANQVDLNIVRETAAVLTLRTRDTPLSLYASVSRRLIADVRTEQYLCEIADAFSLTMSQIHLQIARTRVDDWTVVLQDSLRSLREVDIRFVLTDINVASDVRRLAERGFDEMHLSSSLSVAAASDPESRRAVSDIVRVAHDCGALVAGTGVDDPQQHDALVESGCDLATGDLYGKPQPANTLD